MGPAPAEPRRIAFLGLGLIGGSLAMAIRAAFRADDRDTPPPAPELVAWTPSGRGPRIARERGIVDVAAASAPEAIEGSDVLVLAGPPLATLDHLEMLAGPWRGALDGDAIVTDVASSKAAVVGRADELGLRFVGGHPMAGREVVGLEAGSAALFVGRPWVVVPGRAAAAADTAAIERLVARVGATPVRMAAEAHDAAVAAISHLPLVVAAALAEAVTSGDDWPVARALAATGWRDMTRLARGDPDMGAGIVATNAEAIAERLVALRSALDAWLAALRPAGGGGPDADAVRRRLAAARAALGDPTPGPGP
ncbi:MAG TPA: prephenate dehydrogenase/arogenate dehydrogenase family protein [Candidatus Limnocylindrales bacterium]|nr:prephenate dehydrogenase/arogenate dehydrogenase family protein [Candidatus Limnocylindrales bacterium]